MNSTSGLTESRRPSDWCADDGTATATAGPPNDGSGERAQRAAADARYQKYASGTPAPEDCNDHGKPNYDFDHCPDAPVNHPVLFKKEPADADEVDIADVKQMEVPDCYLMAPLAAISATPEGRALIKGVIVENKDKDGNVESYTVTLHKPESHWPGATTFSDVKVTVKEPFARGHAEPRASGGASEIWPLVMEKAYAEYRGGYVTMARGGSPADAMEVLTGRPATQTALLWPDGGADSFSADRLKSVLAAGKVVVLGTQSTIKGSGESSTSDPKSKGGNASHHLIGNHAYAVTGTEDHDGRLFLQLHNPWNHADPDPVPFDELTTWFRSATVGSVR
jgi:hypothetical protein